MCRLAWSVFHALYIVAGAYGIGSIVLDVVDGLDAFMETVIAFVVVNGFIVAAMFYVLLIFFSGEEK